MSFSEKSENIFWNSCKYWEETSIKISDFVSTVFVKIGFLIHCLISSIFNCNSERSVIPNITSIIMKKIKNKTDAKTNFKKEKLMN